MRKLIILILIFLTVTICTISVGYSAFNTNLSISGEALVRADGDIRITDLKFKDSANSGSEGANSNYSKSLTSMSIELPNSNSSVTYTITITNKTDKYFTLKSITNEIFQNSNIKYSLVGIEPNKVYQGSTYTFDIVFTTTSPNQVANVTLDFNFETVNQTIWNYDYSGKEETFKTPYNATYKLEAWGAQGGTVTNTLANTTYYGGYGGYSVGEIDINANTNLYINVGGSGKACLVYGTTTAGTRTCGDDGGYNGGGSTRQYVGSTFYGSGGGATHIAKVSGLLSTLSSYMGTFSSSTGTYNSSEILIVAGGGGGASTYNNISYAAHGGAGGGYVGANAEPVKVDRQQVCTGGGQDVVGTGSDSGDMGFGRGADITRYVGPGAGGGWYGGGTSELYGCGGSSFIGNPNLKNKTMYCYNCTESASTHIKTVETKNVSENAFSNYTKKGNGYIKITVLPAN